MANYIKNSFLVLLILAINIVHADSSITFEPWHGRLGDQLWNICKSLMLADKYSLPFVYRTFADSDKFAIHHKIVGHEGLQKKYIKVTHETDIEKNINKDVLFLSHFYTKPNDIVYNYCLEHTEFHQKLKSLFLPNSAVEHTIPPKDNTITVALHIRKGSNTDTAVSSIQEYDNTDNTTYLIKQEEVRVSSASCKTSSNAVDRRYPLKFPPNQFYIDAINKLSELLGHPSLYVHLFTDHHNPEALLKRIKQSINLQNIAWGTRSNKIKQEATIINDFYCMTQCNCLIRSDSSFSKVVQLLGNYQAIVYPIHGTWDDKNKLIIDQVGIIYDDC